LFSTLNGAFSDAARVYGKMVFAEDDHHPSEFSVSGESRDAWHDEMSFKRNFAMVASHGIDMWHYSLGCGWLAYEHRWKCVGELLAAAKELKRRPRVSTAEVALVVDDRSVSALPLDPGLVASLILGTVASAAQAGAAFDLYELESFFKADIAQYKFVIFCDLIRVDEWIAAELERVRPGRTLYFQHAAGYRRDEGGATTFSAENASRSIGMTMKATVAQPLIVWYDPDRMDLGGVRADIRYGFNNGRRCNPVLAADDPDAEIFGVLADGGPGLVRKRTGGGTAIYSSAPSISPALLNALYRDAGVFLRISSGPVVYENAGMLALTAQARGSFSLALRHGEQLRDVSRGKSCEASPARTWS
jgi:hypothetical protein